MWTPWRSSTARLRPLDGRPMQFSIDSLQGSSGWRSIGHRIPLAPALLFLAAAWGGFFAVVGGFLLAGAAVAIATAQEMRPSLVAFSVAVIVSAAIGALLVWKAQAGPLILRLFIAIVVAAAAAGLAGTLIVF